MAQVSLGEIIEEGVPFFSFKVIAKEVVRVAEKTGVEYVYVGRFSGVILDADGLYVEGMEEFENFDLYVEFDDTYGTVVLKAFPVEARSDVEPFVIELPHQELVEKLIPLVAIQLVKIMKK